MAVNYLAVLVCAIMSMVLGMIWYGPLFGRKWMEVIGLDPALMDDKEKRKEMSKGAGRLYTLQLFLSVLESYAIVLFFQGGWPQSIQLLIFIWIGFIVPILGGASLWGGDSPKKAWMRFGIQAGYQIVFIVLASIVLSVWQ